MSEVAAVPKPKLVRAVAPDSATHPVAEPTIKFPSAEESPAIVVKSASYACTFVPIASPKLERAVAPDSATQFEPLPTMMFPSVVAKPAISVKPAS